eukprot:534894-Pelagomonas_calceolata.AAC.1
MPQTSCGGHKSGMVQRSWQAGLCKKTHHTGNHAINIPCRPQEWYGPAFVASWLRKAHHTVDHAINLLCRPQEWYGPAFLAGWTMLGLGGCEGSDGQPTGKAGEGGRTALSVPARAAAFAAALCSRSGSVTCIVCVGVFTWKLEAPRGTGLRQKLIGIKLCSAQADCDVLSLAAPGLGSKMAHQERLNLTGGRSCRARLCALLAFSLGHFWSGLACMLKQLFPDGTSKLLQLSQSFPGCAQAQSAFLSQSAFSLLGCIQAALLRTRAARLHQAALLSTCAARLHLSCPP